MKIYVVGGDTNYVNFIENAELVDKLEDAQLVVFTGGEDVTPSFYGCLKYLTTYSNPERDKEEKAIFDRINPETQVVYGCCRGSQFTCVMNGGKLVQDVTNHARGVTHDITDGNRIYQITSTHHQMQYPFNLSKTDYDILFTSFNISSSHYFGDGIIAELIYDKEPEIVYYHKKGLPKCLAVQGHPEMIPDYPVAKMINNLLNDLVNGNI